MQHQQEQTSDSVVEHCCDIKPSLQAAIAGLWPCLPPSCTLCRHHAAPAAVMRLLPLYAALPPSCGPCHRHAVPATVMRSLPPSCGPAAVMRLYRCHVAPAATMWTLLLHLLLLLLLQSPRHCLQTGGGPCSGSEGVGSSTRNRPVYRRKSASTLLYKSVNC
jgi:hypothetical protein